jgi:glycopeptide antibiotics resistance protein
MHFFYLRDPLFLTCVVIYFINRFVLKNIWETGFVHEHANDLICIPFWVPIMLFAQRRLGFRADDEPPRAGELIVALIVWSWVFEIALPRSLLFGDYCVADVWDIVFYTIGTLLGALFWKWWYRPRTT